MSADPPPPPLRRDRIDSTRRPPPARDERTGPASRDRTRNKAHALPLSVDEAGAEPSCVVSKIQPLGTRPARRHQHSSPFLISSTTARQTIVVQRWQRIAVCVVVAASVGPGEPPGVVVAVACPVAGSRRHAQHLGRRRDVRRSHRDVAVLDRPHPVAVSRHAKDHRGVG